MQGMKQGMTCDALGCINPIMRRCSRCKGSYCLRHMAQGNVLCDQCIAAKQKAGGSVMRWGCYVSLGSIALMLIGFAISGGDSHAPPATAMGLVGGLVFWVGVVIFIVGALKRG